MSQLAINPDWKAARFELMLAMTDGRIKELPEPLRFREQDKDAALKAFKEHNWITLHQLAIGKYVTTPYLK